MRLYKGRFFELFDDLNLDPYGHTNSGVERLYGPRNGPHKAFSREVYA